MQARKYRVLDSARFQDCECVFRHTMLCICANIPLQEKIVTNDNIDLEFQENLIVTSHLTHSHDSHDYEHMNC